MTLSQTSVLLNGQVVNEETVEYCDLFLKNGRIEKIDRNLSHIKADTVLDCAGKYILPGMIDDQVHFREPGLTHKGCIATESQAAVSGGITSYMEMPNCQPSTTDQNSIEAKRERAAQASWANYAFYLGATNDNIEAIKRIDTQLICGVKVFMGASTGELLVDNPQALENIFQHCPVLIATHCEDTPMIRDSEEKYRTQYGDALPFRLHPEIRSREACLRSSQLAVELAKRYGTQLHVLHLTTADELALFNPGPVEHKKITCEACVHHLFFSDADYDRLEGRIKCNPAIKTQQDRHALLMALTQNVIDIIATDHAPHTLAEKSQDYWHSPAGLPLVQEALLSLFEHVKQGTLTLTQLVEKVSHNVARRFNIQGRGFIREGYWADLVVVDPNAPQVSQDEKMLYRCGWTPFADQQFSSKILATFVNGALVFQDMNESLQAQLVPGPQVAQALVFDRTG